uniref:hypothetical protein n=1 Tax=Adhaeribacter arboris TaxID=2072846 RepID=UPI0018EC471F|nr:hypothetical protein [Adhaeribacter arboris]
MLLAATAFNLKKYMKFKPVKVVSQALALVKEQQNVFASYFIAFTTLFTTRKVLPGAISSDREISQA